MRAAPFLAFVLASLPASAGVLVVDAAGGGEFTSLVAAVAVAADGDTLLVRPGDYRDPFGNSLLIMNRSLVIAADGAGSVRTNPFWVQGAGKRVVLRGLTIEAGLHDFNVTLRLVIGDLFVEGCTILGRDGSAVVGSSSGGTGIMVSDGRLVLEDSVVQGGRGGDGNSLGILLAQSGGIGIHVNTAPEVVAPHVVVRGGSVTGGAGGDFVDVGVGGVPGNGAAGSIGILANKGATLLLAGCTVTGGHGGDGTMIPGVFAPSTYDGGDGVHIAGNVATTLSLLEATLAGGTPGVDGAGTPGSPGDALETGPFSTVVSFPGAHRNLSFGAPAPEGGTLNLVIEGVAGDLVGLFASPTPALLPGPQGFFHLGAPLLGPYILGPIGGTGSLALSFTVPNLGFGPDDAVTIHAQALVKPASGFALLSSTTTAVLVDDSL